MMRDFSAHDKWIWDKRIVEKVLEVSVALNKGGESRGFGA
jgi:hypothetical protein